MRGGHEAPQRVGVRVTANPGKIAISPLQKDRHAGWHASLIVLNGFQKADFPSIGTLANHSSFERGIQRCSQSPSSRLKTARQGYSAHISVPRKARHVIAGVGETCFFQDK